MLVSFDRFGLLPVGIHIMTWREIEAHFVTGVVHNPGTVDPPFNVPHRAKLLKNYRVLLSQLVACGITEHYIDGSFVTSQSKPNDIDGLFVCASISHFFSQTRPQLIEQDICWSKEHPKYPGGMQERYEIELFPVFLDYPQQFGKDANSKKPLDPISFFQQSKIEDPDNAGFYLPKGIVKLNLTGGGIKGD